MDLLRSKVTSAPDHKDALAGMYGPNGFFFQQRRGHLNLRSLASIDLEKLVREVDVDLLQLHIENLTFCNLKEEDLKYMTDPQVVKLFKISQLIIEYLLYSQDSLVTNLNELSRKYSAKKR
jgi:zinc finger protein DZIP1